jgi:hypothetical protein
MAHHHVTSADIAINGDHLDSSKVSKVKSTALGVAVIGSVISLYLLFFSSEKTQGTYAYSWLFAFYFYLTLSIGGVFWVLLHNVSNASWALRCAGHSRISARPFRDVLVRIPF